MVRRLYMGNKKFSINCKNCKKTFEKAVSLLNKIPLPLLLLILLLPLRLIYLGYSEYICDETVALNWLRLNDSFYSTEFLLLQHKGPMQYVIAGIVFLITKTVFNEYTFRLPFALANCLSLVVFYLFIKNVTKNKWAAFVSAFLFGVNGFLVAFGRIFQYQDLNLLFSISSLYFYSKISADGEKEDSVIKNSAVGTVFFCLSLLSHWDAVFIVPYLLFVIFKNVILKQEYSRKFKSKFILVNFLTLLLLAVFYLIPYLKYFINSAENQAYFQTRVGPSAISWGKFVGRVQFIIFRIKLYNPLLFFEFCIAVLALSLVFIKKTWFYLAWFVAEMLVFTLIFTSPGTHIYNIFIPLAVSLALSLSGVFNFLGKRSNRVKIIFTPLVFAVPIFFMSFFYYQSYVLFVDHSPEYPWKSKIVAKKEVGKFSVWERKNYLSNNKIGFPLRREWKQIEDAMAEYEKENDIPVGSIGAETNENLCPASFYTGRRLGKFPSRFIVAIRYPLSLVNDYKNFSRIKNKELIKVIKNEAGDTVASVYVVR